MALEARAGGQHVLLLDSGTNIGASQAAAGLIALRWYKQPTIRAKYPPGWGPNLAEEGIEWLQKYTEIKQTGEWFTNGMTGKQHFDSDFYVLPDPMSLLRQGCPALVTVNRVVRQGATWQVECDRATYTSRAIVITAGAATNSLLGFSGLPTVPGLSGLWGEALIITSSLETDVPKTYMPRPYSQFTLRSWGAGKVRLGDTTFKHQWGLYAKSLELLKCCKHFGLVPNVAAVQRGVRPVTPQFYLKRIAPRCIVATGGHRVGLALSGPVAKRALGLL